jgi:hypothetical protein
MTKKGNRKPNLYQPATYQIKVPGALDAKSLDWNGGVTVAVESDRSDAPITILTISIDQAGLQGLLHHLYTLDLPLISVRCIDCS